MDILEGALYAIFVFAALIAMFTFGALFSNYIALPILDLLVKFWERPR